MVALETKKHPREQEKYHKGQLVQVTLQFIQPPVYNCQPKVEPSMIVSSHNTE